jgi:hypothetical protein
MINYLSGTYNFDGINMPEGGVMTSDDNLSNIREKAQNWFMEDGWSVRKEPAPDATWAIVADDGKGRKVVVGQTPGRDDQLLFQGAVIIDDITSDKINELPESERNNLLWDIRFELIKTDLEFMGIEAPLKRVEVMGRIFFDALTKDAFLNKVSQVRKGILIVIWMLAKKFATQPPRKELGFHR